jgi:hypothetical protein
MGEGRKATGAAEVMITLGLLIDFHGNSKVYPKFMNKAIEKLELKKHSIALVQEG